MARGGWSGFRVELSFLEAAALITGAVGSSFVVFLLGVWVGKGWEARRLQGEQQVVRIPVDENVQAASRKKAGELLFYEALTRSGRTATRSKGSLLGAPARKKARSRARGTQGEGASRTTVSSISTKRARGKEQVHWSVQVLASKEEKSAKRLVAGLREGGFNAYVVRLRRLGQTRYRVRVGPFPTLESAKRVAARLRGRSGITEAFVASD